MIIDTKEYIDKARILTLKSALKLEVGGIRIRRGFSAYATIKKEFGFKGNKQKVLNQLNDYVNTEILGTK